MTSSLTPELALDYLGSLWVDLRGAVVLDPDWSRVAGDAALTAQATALLVSATGGGAERSETPHGVLYAARSDTHAVAVLVGPDALEAVVVCDLLAVLDDLAGC